MLQKRNNKQNSIETNKKTTRLELKHLQRQHQHTNKV